MLEFNRVLNMNIFLYADTLLSLQQTTGLLNACKPSFPFAGTEAAITYMICTDEWKSCSLHSPSLAHVVTQALDWLSCLSNERLRWEDLHHALVTAPVIGVPAAFKHKPTSCSYSVLFSHPFITHRHAHCGLNMLVLKSHLPWSVGGRVTGVHPLAVGMTSKE